jgi:monofunctional biosynthetic peptidoglycan transglycosylase
MADTVLNRTPETETAAPAASPPRAGTLQTVAACFAFALRSSLKVALWFVLLCMLGIVGLIVAYRYINPPASTLMLAYWVDGEPTTQRWVPLARISPNLIRAVIASEDGQFCHHRGVDWTELAVAMEQTADGAARGGSTISMQVTKNLFLWPDKSYVRKALEIPLTLLLEAVWPKERILEVYLNIVEWGPGVFGAEAAARYHFRTSASQLNEYQAALLAVALPNPIERVASRPGPGMRRLTAIVHRRMGAVGRRAACVLRRPGAAWTEGPGSWPSGQNRSISAARTGRADEYPRR